ncbi:MAG: hypothetical protein A2428_17400 [Bdellovibrionales bacterium RIFOXYC1_FULL_54_43]|nr:MAG: hypothetical protein A2428_17400 [Bdellovibrionales bacterium RIFOXYC1_FULL_54_43]OFZ83416.1 MAG: hypothetical protein A2603_05670 [Bdellovibrionales bacterium RIFOXYD1_FULL_55_31]
MADIIPVGVVGGGKGGEQFLAILSQSSQIKVMFICDPNPAAPGLAMARKLGIPTHSSTDEVALEGIQFVFEVTGSAKVLAMLREKIPAEKLIDNRTAFFLFSVLNEVNRKTNQQVEKDIHDIRTQILASTTKNSEMLHAINTIANELRIVGLNMSIEASRLGQQAAGFTVIADKVQQSVLAVKNMAQEIAKVNSGMLLTMENVEATRKRLAESMTASDGTTSGGSPGAGHQSPSPTV